jgi:hypothetical protein
MIIRAVHDTRQSKAIGNFERIFVAVLRFLIFLLQNSFPDGAATLISNNPELCYTRKG